MGVNLSRTLALPAWQPRLRVAPSSLVGLAMLGMIVLLVVTPVALMVVESFHEGPFGRETAWGIANWQAALTDPTLAGAIGNTITLSLARVIIGIVVAVGLAWLLARADIPGTAWLELGFWIAVFMPPLTVNLAWIMIFDSYNGVANQLLERLPFVSGAVFSIYSWWGIVAAHLLSGGIAVQVMLLAPAFRNLDASLEEASLTAGEHTLGTLRRIVVPLLAPTIIVVMLLGLVRGLEGFETELVLGTPAGIDVFGTKIYRITQQEPPAYGIATAMSMVIVVLSLPLILTQQAFARRRNFATLSSKFSARRVWLGVWRWPAFALVALAVVLMTVVPALLIITGTFMNIFGYFAIPQPWTLKNWQAVLTNRTFVNALENTLLIAGASSLTAMTAFTTMAYIIVRTRFAARQLLDFMVWVPSTVPGIILSLGFLTLFLGTPFLRPMYGTVWIMILVAALGGVTLITQIMKTNLLQIGSELEEASWAAGAPWFFTFRRVVLPLITPSVVAVGVLSFSLAARATGSVALLSTPTNQPLSMLQLTLAASTQLGAASVIGVFLMFLSVGVAVTARFVLGVRIDPMR
ncbi:MAG: iron ABC transporter permease [Chloroflexi bacterium]|nr:iron ABC transporter permease [Chloroflexota bacterium]